MQTSLDTSSVYPLEEMQTKEHLLHLCTCSKTNA